ncbi:MAG: glycosyltransferase, partial [Planctomycetota bacterium]
MRIAHVQLLPLLSGVQRVTLDELERLDPETFDRTLVLQSPGPFSKAAERLGVTVRYVPELIRHIRPAPDWRAYQKLKDLFRRERFDIVHTHSS